MRQTQADLVTASLAPNPTASTGGTLLPLNRAITVENPGGPSEFDVGVSYPIDWFLFGKRAAAMASASAGVNVSEADFADMVRQRVTDTAIAYYDVLEAESLLLVAQQDMENMERVEGITRKAVENGGRPQVELNRMRLELLGTRRALRDAETMQINAKASLRALLGTEAVNWNGQLDGSLDGPVSAEIDDIENAYSQAVRNRPDVLSLQRKVIQANANVVVENRNAMPEITPNVGMGYQFQRPIGCSDFNSWGIGIDMTVPLFNRNQGNRQKAAAAVSQTNYELQTVLLDLRAEVEQAVQTLKTAKENAGLVAQEELQLAIQVRDSIGKAYEIGGRPLIDALDAQRNFRETYRTYVTTRADYWRAVYKYNSVIGRQAIQ